MSPNKKKSLLFSLSCGCRNFKSVSVSVSDTPDKSPNPKRQKPDTPSDDLRPSLSSGDAAPSSSWEEKEEECSFSGDSTSSFSGLLRQLNELEQNLLSWGCQIPANGVRRGHSTSMSDGGRVKESVAVVKNSDDPLNDFRRSMLQMIVEKEIVGAEELKELVQRFLALNSPQHYDVILRAFSEIWSEVFSNYQSTPDFLMNLRG